MHGGNINRAFSSSDVVFSKMFKNDMTNDAMHSNDAKNYYVCLFEKVVIVDHTV